MRKIGFEILNTKTSYDETHLINDPDYYILPPLYRLFTKLFELGVESFNFDKLYWEEKDQFRQFQSFYYGPCGNGEKSISFTHFDTVKDVLHNRRMLYGYTNEEISMGLLMIGGIALGGGLFVGTNKDNSDQIYYNIWDNEEGVVKLAESIFEFAKDLVLEGNSNLLPKGVGISQLYKNWYEDFWRVHE